jgi:hypothetical protein
VSAVIIPPLVIRGIVPAVLLGLTTVLTRLSIGGGVSIPIFLASVGVTIAVVGGASAFATGQAMTGGRAIWLRLSILKLPIAIVAPLTNSNSLVAVPRRGAAERMAEIEPAARRRRHAVYLRRRDPRIPSQMTTGDSQ